MPWHESTLILQGWGFRVQCCKGYDKASIAFYIVSGVVGFGVQGLGYPKALYRLKYIIQEQQGSLTRVEASSSIKGYWVTGKP